MRWLLVLGVSLTMMGCVSLTPYAEVRAGLAPENLVEIDGRPVYVEDRGPQNQGLRDHGLQDSVPVVFLHGFGGSSYAWRRVVERLPQRRTIVLDLYGFGWTERPPGLEPYTRQGQVKLVLDLLDRLGIDRRDRVDLVGHSYGGSVAAAFAIAHPGRLRSLALVNAAHPEYPRRRRSVLARCRPLVALYLKWALRPGRIRQALERSVVDDSIATSDLAAAYLDRVAVEGARHAFRALTVPLPEALSDGPPLDLSQVETPTLVLWGEEDALISLEDGRRAAERLPCHRFVPVPGAGHLPMEEKPDELAAALQELWRDPPAGCREDRKPDPGSRPETRVE